MAALVLAGCALSPPAPTLDQRTAVFAGTLAFEGGRPAAAVRVRLWLLGAAQEAASDEQGRFEMTLLEPAAARFAWCGGGAEPGVAPEPVVLKAGTRTALTLAVKAAGRSTAPCDAFFAAAASGAPQGAWARASGRPPLQPVRPIKAALPGKDAAATLRGSVLDARGAPAAAVRVSLRRAGEERVAAEVASDADGRFELKPLTPGRYDLEASGEGAAEVVRGLWLGPGRARELAVRFGGRRGQVLVQGRVLGPDGAPVAGARVGAVSEAAGGGIASEVVHSRADGRFALAVAEAAPAELFADSPDGALAGAVRLPASEGELTGELELHPLAPRATCAGRVTFPDGSPAAGATVRASRTRGAPARAGVVVTGPDGSWRLACPDGSAQLRATLGAAVAIAEAAVPCSGLDLRLAPGAALRVRITFREPVQRLVAQVLPLDDEDPPPAQAALRRRAETDGEPFEVDGLPVGSPIDVSVVAADGRAAQGSVVLPGASIWEVELPLDEPRR